MEMMRRLASGRLSELAPSSILGISLGTPFLPIDRIRRAARPEPAATPPAAPNNPHQPNVTKPQCNGAENSSSTNQNAWPHSFNPTFGRMNIGPTTAATNANDVAWLYSGSRVCAYR